MHANVVIVYYVLQILNLFLFILYIKVQKSRIVLQIFRLGRSYFNINLNARHVFY